MGRCQKWWHHQCVQCAINFFHLVGPFAYFSLDPATGEELGAVPEMGIEETREAINAAARAFTTWSKTTAKVTAPAILKCTPTSHGVGAATP